MRSTVLEGQTTRPNIPEDSNLHEENLLLGYDAVYGVISQKKILFKTSAVKTSNPTQ
jgi:hypothetical protein